MKRIFSLLSRIIKIIGTVFFLTKQSCFVVTQFIGLNLKRIWHQRIFRIPLIFLLIYVIWITLIQISLYVFPLPIDKIEQNYSKVYLARNNELMRISLSNDGKYKIKLRLDDISEYLKRGFLIYEDRFFYLHPGFNPVSIFRSLVQNIRNGKIISGGSTITMQIARMTENPNKKRTVYLKFIELLRAIQLERKYSKKELMEIYLNMVPMGGNIEGVGAASYLYFGKSAGELSLGQASLLICLPKSPTRYRPDIYPDRAKIERSKVLNRICQSLHFTERIKKESDSEEIPVKRFENPNLVPNLVIRTQDINPMFIKRYTIDLSLQKHCEVVLKNSIDSLKKYGVYNSAMIIVDNHSMEILVYIGSQDFSDDEHYGKINGANIKRSPGSLLKPFLYAKGIEKGIITPKKILFDVERNYDGFVPANYSRTYIGQVSTMEALTRSLNVPAVNLEFELKKDGLLEFIRQARLIDEKRIKNDPGLSLVLGAYPMTLEELVKIYSCLANKGMLREFEFFKDTNRKNVGNRILMEETCFIISEMLSNMERTDLPQCWEFTNNRGKIAFKTGTSFGLRDAWSIGYNPDYTIGVWLGNMNNKGSHALVGIKAAAPIVVDIFNYFTRYKDSWFKRPEKVELRKVCTVSGEKAGSYCKKTLMDYYIPGISSEKICSVHHCIYVKKSNGMEVCRYCMNGKPKEYKEKIVEIWSPDIASYLRMNGKSFDVIPKHNPLCFAINDKKGLKIKSPLKGGVYTISKALSVDEQKIALKAESDVNNEDVYWFVDNVVIAKGSPDETFFIKPDPGKHKITVMNSRGQYDTVETIVSEAVQ